MPFISSWVIVGTGSEDGTQHVIRSYLANAGIPGELYERPWRHTRRTRGRRPRSARAIPSRNNCRRQYLKEVGPPYFLERCGFLEFASFVPEDPAGARLARIRREIEGRFWLHLGEGRRFFVPDCLISRLTRGVRD